MMENDFPILRVKMLGGFSMSYDSEPILFRKNSATKSMKLLQILLYYGETGIARGRLLENLYGREELADQANNLRVTAHRMKKMLADLGLPEYDYIQIKGGVYYWSSPMKVQIDVREFSELIKLSENEPDIRRKEKLLLTACGLYRGELLPDLSTEEWVLLENVQYKEQYERALQNVCKYLKEDREYERIIELCDNAIGIYPFDEWQSVKIDCLMAVNRYKEAVQVYEDTSRMFFEELGISPSEKMLAQFKEMSSKMTRRYGGIGDIKGSLKEEEEDDGAFYCSLPSFRDSYRLLRRIVERNGQSVYLMLCSITNGKGKPMENKDKLDEMADVLFKAVKASLRRGDSFTRYSPTQFLILLIGTNQENCRIIFERISSGFMNEHKSWKQYLEYYVSSIAEVENSQSRISFKGDHFRWD